MRRHARPHPDAPVFRRRRGGRLSCLGRRAEGFEVPESAISFALSYGGRGVDLFFVISGFIIFYATHAAKLTPAQFLRRRVERIVPLYFFVIFAVTMLAITLPATFGTPDWYTPRHILKSLAFIAFTDGEMPVVYVGWSLEYEMYFYLAVALLMALTRDVWRNIVVMFSALAIVGQLPGVGAALGNYAFFADPMILEFVLGVIVGSVFVNGRVGWPMPVAAACAIAALLVTDPFSRVIVSGVPAACLVAAAAFSAASASIRRGRSARWRGWAMRPIRFISRRWRRCRWQAVHRGPDSSHSAAAAADGHKRHRRGARPALNILVERPLLKSAGALASRPPGSDRHSTRATTASRLIPRFR